MQDIFIRIKAGQGLRSITRELGVHRSVVRSIDRLARERGWLNSDQRIPDEYEIAEAKYGQVEKSGPHPFDAHLDAIKDWLKADYSFVVMSTLLRERIPDGPCSESTIRRYIQVNLPVLRPATMVREHTPGESLDVDFGYVGMTREDFAGKPHKTWVFSARLRSSRHAYRVCVHSQNQYVFYRCLVEAFEFFGGVPEKVVPDNLKAAVIKAAFFEPEINRVFRKLAEHYGFMISPCLPQMPKHKGGVENDVKYIKRNFLPVFIEHQKALGHEVPLLADMNQALSRWTDETAGMRIVRGVGASPLDMFHGFEQETLRPLPERRWDPVTYRECRVASDWRIQFDKAFYSVPYAYIGEKVLVMSDSLTVCVFFKGSEIARHPRAKQPWQYQRNTKHAPAHPEQYMSTTRAMLLSQAKFIGDPVHDVAQKILSNMVVDGIRPVRGLLHLAKSFSAERLGLACERALRMNTVTYGSVKSILVKHLEKQEVEPELDFEAGSFSFSRQPQEYTQHTQEDA